MNWRLIGSAAKRAASKAPNVQTIGGHFRRNGIRTPRSPDRGHTTSSQDDLPQAWALFLGAFRARAGAAGSDDENVHFTQLGQPGVNHRLHLPS